MPKKRKLAREFCRPGELTGWQREVLLGGIPILDPLDGTTFDDACAWGETAEAAAAWRANKVALMAEWRAHPAHVGHRPLRWWHDRAEEPPRGWGADTAHLIALGEVDLVEQGRFEALYLRPFDISDPPTAQTMATRLEQLGRASIETEADRYTFARDWHQARGHTELARYFQAYLDGVLEVLGRRPKLELVKPI